MLSGTLHLSPLASHLSPLTSRLSPLTSPVSLFPLPSPRLFVPFVPFVANPVSRLPSYLHLAFSARTRSTT